MGVSLLLTKQRSRRRRCQASGKASRACPLGFGWPPPPAHTQPARPLRAPPPPFLPSPLPLLPLPVRLRARASPPFRFLCACSAIRFAYAHRSFEVVRRWAGPEAARDPGAPPILGGLWAALRKRTLMFKTRNWASSRRACAEGAALRRRLDVGGGDWVVQMGDSNDEREVLRLGNEHPGRKVKPRGGQTAQGRDRTHAGVRAGLGNALILALARPCLLCKALPWPHFLQNLLRPSN